MQSFQCFRLRRPLYTHFHGSFRPRWPLGIHFHWSFRLEAIFWIPSNILLHKIRCFLQTNVCFPRKLSILSSELHTFCSHKDSQSKAPVLLCKSVSSYRKEVKLTFELQGNDAKHSGLILLRKIRCFLKRTRFLTYSELPVGSSTVCKDFASKTLCF